MRALVVSVLAVLAACTPRAARSAIVVQASDPKLDVPVPWVDVEAFYPRGTAPPVVPLTHARDNPSAPTIAIRGATILTATGARIERGTIVLAGGAIAAIGGADVAVPA